MTIHLLDSNTFIDAKRLYYAFDIAPGFWQWVLRGHSAFQLGSVRAVRRELLAFEDDLSEWVVASVPPSLFQQPDRLTVDAMARVSDWVVNSDRFTAPAKGVFQESADLQLIGHAMAHDMTVVTLEGRNPVRRNKVLIPEVCDRFGVNCLLTWDSMRELGVRLELAA